jgi:acyl-CoA synthetase (AMP-forming)/AMP-acid ligase II
VRKPGISTWARSAEEVITWSRDRIAGFTVPRSVEFLDELPLTSTGKVLKDQLG